VTVWHRTAHAFAALGTSAQAGHLGIQSGFIEEEQSARGQYWLPGLPLLTPLLYVWPLLLGGVQGFFYTSDPVD
jgi:hypothetical protein